MSFSRATITSRTTTDGENQALDRQRKRIRERAPDNERRTEKKTLPQVKKTVRIDVQETQQRQFQRVAMSEKPKQQIKDKEQKAQKTKEERRESEHLFKRDELEKAREMEKQKLQTANVQIEPNKQKGKRRDTRGKKPIEQEARYRRFQIPVSKLEVIVLPRDDQPDQMQEAPEHQPETTATTEPNETSTDGKTSPGQINMAVEENTDKENQAESECQHETTATTEVNETSPYEKTLPDQINMATENITWENTENNIQVLDTLQKKTVHKHPRFEERFGALDKATVNRIRMANRYRVPRCTMLLDDLKNQIKEKEQRRQEIREEERRDREYLFKLDELHEQEMMERCEMNTQSKWQRSNIQVHPKDMNREMEKQKKEAECQTVAEQQQQMEELQLKRKADRKLPKATVWKHMASSKDSRDASTALTEEQSQRQHQTTAVKGDTKHDISLFNEINVAQPKTSRKDIDRQNQRLDRLRKRLENKARDEEQRLINGILSEAKEDVNKATEKSEKRSRQATLVEDLKRQMKEKQQRRQEILEEERRERQHLFKLDELYEQEKIREMEKKRNLQRANLQMLLDDMDRARKDREREKQRDDAELQKAKRGQKQEEEIRQKRNAEQEHKYMTKYLPQATVFQQMVSDIEECDDLSNLMEEESEYQHEPTAFNKTSTDVETSRGQINMATAKIARRNIDMENQALHRLRKSLEKRTLHEEQSLHKRIMSEAKEDVNKATEKSDKRSRQAALVEDLNRQMKEKQQRRQEILEEERRERQHLFKLDELYEQEKIREMEKKKNLQRANLQMLLDDMDRARKDREREKQRDDAELQKAKRGQKQEEEIRQKRNAEQEHKYMTKYLPQATVFQQMVSGMEARDDLSNLMEEEAETSPGQVNMAPANIARRNIDTENQARDKPLSTKAKIEERNGRVSAVLKIPPFQRCYLILPPIQKKNLYPIRR